MQKHEIKYELIRIETELESTKEAMAWSKGPVNDALKLVIPMIKDLIEVDKRILELIKE